MENQYYLESTLDIYNVILNDNTYEVHISNRKIVAVYGMDNKTSSPEDIGSIEEYLSEIISK
jgi:hypothetical protein